MKNSITQLPGPGFIIIFLLVLLSMKGGVADNRNLKAECEKTRQKIAKIQSKMRHGYRVSEGVKMQEQLLRLRKLRSKYCR